MIDPTEQDVGRWVEYSDGLSKKECGVVVGFSSVYVFVEFKGQVQSCPHRRLEWLTPPTCVAARRHNKTLEVAAKVIREAAAHMWDEEDCIKELFKLKWPEEELSDPGFRPDIKGRV